MRIGVAGKWFIVGFIFAAIFSSSAIGQQLDQKVGQQYDQKVGQQYDQKLFSECAGAASARSAEAVPWPFPACRISRTFSTWLRSTAASGKPPISVTPGIRFSTTSLAAPSARWPLPLPIRTSSMSAAAKVYNAPISRPATAFTNPPTRGKPGHICKTCATRSKSPPSSSTRRIPTASSSPPKGHPYGSNAERGVFRSTDGGTIVPESSLQG